MLLTRNMYQREGIHSHPASIGIGGKPTRPYKIGKLVTQSRHTSTPVTPILRLENIALYAYQLHYYLGHGV